MSHALSAAENEYAQFVVAVAQCGGAEREQVDGMGGAIADR
jgi:hypothetical protein